MRILKLPENDKTNGWSNILPNRVLTPTLQGKKNADCLVIGAGFAGLAAARKFAELHPDQSIIILEAGVVGENASGRNSGFAIDTPHTTSTQLAQLKGAHQYMNLARGAIAELEKQVKHFNIDCDWSRDGKYQAAVTAEGSKEMLEPVAHTLDCLNEPYEWIEADTLRERLGTTHFHRAIYTPGCVLINPAALVTGLADNLPQNVTLYENSPVIDIEYHPDVQAKTSLGAVHASKVIIATNGFSENFGFAQHTFVHLALAASLSRPLNDTEMQAYGVQKTWGMTPANGIGGITMRFTQDRRLLIRQEIRIAMGLHFSAKETAKLAVQHKRLFDERFPMLPNVNMQHTWVGFICKSRNGAPFFGQVADNVWLAACQNGIGVTTGTINGMLVACLAGGEDHPLIADIESLGRANRLPPKILVEIGARAKLHWEIWKNRKEA